ncbi:hypothetical protein [Sulfurovum sp.]|uniref:hypothetical protein n=1 Tax=Sulfurovum sp. TaxID=1969726 RepID=UPI002867B174|nr:hypothetical protein [Sulfurovum sp.]
MNEDLLYIEDANNRKLYYRFSPSVVTSNFVPLLVNLHGEAGVGAEHFEYKMWNVLTPIDDFGYENKGSCWLGEKGDFFVKDLLQKLIYQLADTYECEDHIYLYGSGMGGYGAILHGMLCKANAIYAHAPYIRLMPSQETNAKMHYLFDTIFGETVSKENDLSNFLNPTDSFPIFYLSHNKDDFEDDTTYFVNACKKHSIRFHLESSSKSVEDENHTLKEVLSMLERMSSQ